jgi:hypothetical protein
VCHSRREARAGRCAARIPSLVALFALTHPEGEKDEEGSRQKGADAQSAPTGPAHLSHEGHKAALARLHCLIRSQGLWASHSSACEARVYVLQVSSSPLKVKLGGRHRRALTQRAKLSRTQHIYTTRKWQLA